MKAKRLQLPMVELEWLNLIALCIGLANVAFIWFFLTRIDNIVNVQLYSYGLTFNPNWSDQYTSVTNLIKIFIIWSIALNVIIIGIGINRIRSKTPSQVKEIPEPSPQTQTIQLPEKQEEPLETVVEAPVATPVTITEVPDLTEDTEIIEVTSEPEATQVASEPNQPQAIKKETLEIPKLESDGLICPNCKQTIGKPIPVLDFSENKVRFVNTCPHCKFVLGAASLKENTADSKK